MRIEVRVNLDESRDEITLTREEVAQLVFDALGGDPEKDMCTAYIMAPMEPAVVGTNPFAPPPIPDPPVTP